MIELEKVTNVPNITDNNAAIASFRYFGIVIGLIDIFAGTAGNLMTIVAVLKNRLLRRNSFNMFILNLSIIDFLTAFLMMPFNVIGYSLMEWPFGSKMCILQAFFYFSCGYTSVVCLVSITLNRVYGIVFPERYNSYFSDNRVRLWLFVTWLVAPMFLLPFLTVSLLNEMNNVPLITGWKSDQLLCTFVSLPGMWKSYMLVLRTMFQFFPAPFMVVSYSVIVYLVRKSHKRIDAVDTESYRLYKQRMQNKLDDASRAAEQNVFETIDVAAETDIPRKKKPRRSHSIFRPFYSLLHRQTNKTDVDDLLAVVVNCTGSKQRNKREDNLVHISIIICSAFTILFLPSLVVNLIPGNQDFDARIHMGVSNITWLNSCINPVIYVLAHKGMRSEYKILVKQIYEKFRNKRPPTDARPQANCIL